MSRKEKKDWDLDTVLSIVGFVFELMRVIVNALRKRGGTIDHLRRLLKEPALVDHVFDLIVDKATKIVLCAGEYLVPVTYAVLPAMAELERQFSKGGVSDLFNTSYAWEQDKSRKDFDNVPGDKAILVKQFTPEEIKEMGGLESENIITWGLKNGYVPGNKEELYALGINPETSDLQRQFWIVALGSSTMDGGSRYVAMLCSASSRRILGSNWFGREWDSDHRFLFVRK